MAVDPRTTAPNVTGDQGGQVRPGALTSVDEGVQARMAAGIAVNGEDPADRALDETDDLAQRSMVRDIDAILERLEGAIATENTAIDALLRRVAA